MQHIFSRCSSHQHLVIKVDHPVIASRDKELLLKRCLKTYHILLLLLLNIVITSLLPIIVTNIRFLSLHCFYNTIADNNEPALPFLQHNFSPYYFIIIMLLRHYYKWEIMYNETIITYYATCFIYYKLLCHYYNGWNR